MKKAFFAMQIKNFGICGNTSEQIWNDEIPRVKEFFPTLAIVLAGTNDTCNPPVLRDLDQIRTSYTAILNDLSRLHAQIIVMTIPPVVERMFLARHTLEEFREIPPMKRIADANVMIRSLASQFGAEVVDLFSEFSERDLEAVDSPIRNFKNADSDDGCHPNSDGYSMISWLVYRKIQEMNADVRRIACIGDSITYGAYMTGAGTDGGDCYPGKLNRLLNPNQEPAKTVTEFVKKAVIYQLFLRAFTPEGTLKAAEAYLPHVAETGANVLYLCPIVQSDTDERKEYWSPRHKQSGMNNAKNPYRLMDYEQIDPEYGTSEELHSFVKTAHACGMKVILDLVYYHCGPTFARKHPEFVKCGQDGAPLNGTWCFPELNFDSAALRAFLLDNMRYFVREFGIDGYRCDVGNSVPLDFWEEGRRAIEAINPDVILLCESELQRVAEQKAAFDLNYSFSWSTHLVEAMRGACPASWIQRIWTERTAAALRGARFLNALDTHDITNDVYEKRFEKEWGSAAVDVALVLCYLMDGVPFLYNGYEDNDTARHSIYSRPGECVIDRSRRDPHRIQLLKRLADLRRSEVALFDGTVEWLSNANPEHLVTLARRYGGERIFVCVNLSAGTYDVPSAVFPLEGEIMLSRASCVGGDGVVRIGPFGFHVVKGKC